MLFPHTQDQFFALVKVMCHGDILFCIQDKIFYPTLYTDICEYENILLLDWEKAAGLEQLRALDAGMTIGARLVDTHPFGVDTPADLAKAQAMMAATGAPSPPKD